MPENLDKEKTNETRRGFLQSVGVTGALVGAVGAETVLLQDAQTQDVATTFALGGRIEGWQGAAPTDIDGQRNPTLSLEAGSTYRLYWQNLDGAAHNFEIRDSAGSALQVLQPIPVDQQTVQQLFADGGQASTPSGGNATGSPATETGTATAGGGAQDGTLVSTTGIVTEEGAAQAVQFTATDEMAQYICPIHPTSMVGDVTLSGGSGAGNSTSG
ncbi:twin-arginine translocation signal domain-containing protein [Halorientalis brevis]|uniref:Twin-arginine translocation signal domain-containing protein n=1 Tax=Halorientalis brevis TaxID=1126241 RepID=A0ABD6CGP8_9EURY|nr:twin-arginine translocation signal domain-containing protein [Halorientalis brevis]